MRPGDIHTHMYNDRQLEIVDRFTGKVQPYMVEARRRGVLFDLGPWRRQLPLARGDQGDGPRIPARHDQHGSSRLEHHDSRIGHAELYFEDDGCSA